MTPGNAKAHTGPTHSTSTTNKLYKLDMHGSAVWASSNMFHIFGSNVHGMVPPAAAANAGSERASHCSGIVERVESQKA